MRRNCEAIQIYMREDSHTPISWLFHQSQAAERLAVGSNRSSKTVSSAADCAMLAMGMHPFRKTRVGPDISCIGYDWPHAGLLFTKMCRPGAIRIIKDEHTQKWRSYRPDEEYDSAYSEKSKDAPPFIPERLWAGDPAWNDKKQDVPRSLKLKNGTMIQFHSSEGIPAQGAEIDVVWLDEEIRVGRWLTESQRGLVARRKTGTSLVYSATPLTASEELYTLHQRANAPEDERLYDIEEFFFLLADNPFISKKAKDEFAAQIITDQDRQVRIHGRFLMAQMAVYPEFNDQDHVIDPFPIPEDWNKVMFVDPGVQVCGVLFVAIPPDLPEDLYDKHRHQIHVYDELYLKRCSATIFAKETAKRMGDQRRGGFRSFVIDRHSAKRTDEGSGLGVEQQYQDALKEEGVWSRETGSGFVYGSNDPKAREEAFRQWLYPNRYTGSPTLRIHRHCRNLIWEIQQQFYKKNPDGTPSDKRRDKHDHLVSDIERAAAASLSWRPLPKSEGVVSRVWQAVQRKRAKERKSGSISLGPS